jgi:hypothetical protein
MYPDWLAPLPQFGKALPADDFDGTLPYCSPANHLRPTKARDDQYVQDVAGPVFRRLPTFVVEPVIIFAGTAG